MSTPFHLTLTRKVMKSGAVVYALTNADTGDELRAWALFDAASHRSDDFLAMLQAFSKAIEAAQNEPL